MFNAMGRCSPLVVNWNGNGHCLVTYQLGSSLYLSHVTSHVKTGSSAVKSHSLSLSHAREPPGCSNPNMLLLWTWCSASHIEKSIKPHACTKLITRFSRGTLDQLLCLSSDTHVHGGERNKDFGCSMAQSCINVR